MHWLLLQLDTHTTNLQIKPAPLAQLYAIVQLVGAASTACPHSRNVTPKSKPHAPSCTVDTGLTSDVP